MSASVFVLGGRSENTNDSTKEKCAIYFALKPRNEKLADAILGSRVHFLGGSTVAITARHNEAFEVIRYGLAQLTEAIHRKFGETYQVEVYRQENGSSGIVELAEKNLDALRPVENILSGELREESRKLRILAEALSVEENAKDDLTFTDMEAVRDSIAGVAAVLERIEESLTRTVMMDVWKMNRDELVKVGICQPEVAV
jgi:hypothetical protein